MLGYFRPLKEELKMKDYYEYRSFYCGHCHLIKNEFSRFSTLMMSYEAVFTAILFTTSKITQSNKIRCTAIPLVKVPVYNTDLMKVTILINQVFMYAKLSDKIADDEGAKYKIVDVLAYFGKAKTKKQLATIGIDVNTIYGFLEKGQKAELGKKTFNEFTEPYRMAMEYIYSEIAGCFDLDQTVYAAIGSDFLILMNLLDAADDYFEDQQNTSFNPLCQLSEKEVHTFFRSSSLKYLDKVVNSILDLNHPYEVLLLNIIGKNINDEIKRIILKLKTRGASSANGKSKLLRYLRSV